MYEKEFSQRLSQLRIEKGVSARDMSLSLGQNAGYINNIETGKALPSMSNFFYICDYFQITPTDFFNYSSPRPHKLDALCQNLNYLTDAQFDSINLIVNDLAQK